MVTAILGKKLGMTQVFAANGDALPATVLKAGPCVVIQRKTTAKDGYDSVQLGLVEVPPPKRVSKAMEGHFKRAEAVPSRFLREVRLGTSDADVKIGDKVLVDQFAVDEYVDVIGVSKGRGFAGFHKRHHFGGGGGSHGSMFHRAPGSIGASAFPSRVYPGTRSSGRLGGRQATAKNLTVVRVDAENNLLYISGAVPGARNAIVKIVRSSFVKKKA